MKKRGIRKKVVRMECLILWSGSSLNRFHSYQVPLVIIDKENPLSNVDFNPKSLIIVLNNLLDVIQIQCPSWPFQRIRLLSNMNAGITYVIYKIVVGHFSFVCGPTGFIVSP